MENGEQKIFVWCDFSEEMDNAIAHGLMIATILHKELCLFHIWAKKLHENVEMAEAKLRGIAAHIVHNSPGVKVHYIVRKEQFSEMLADLAEVYDCILLVAHKKMVPRLLPDLKHSGFPFLFVSSKSCIDKIYTQIVVPVGYMKKSKDLALWASYLGRHNGAMVDIFIASESSEGDRKVVKSNLFSIERLYGKFKFPFEVVESHSPTWKLQKIALGHTLSLKCGLLIIAASYKTTFVDKLLGLTEDKVIEKSEDLSVMCVNSQRDFYTFCG
jgi:hypothetical protein